MTFYPPWLAFDVGRWLAHRVEFLFGATPVEQVLLTPTQIPATEIADARLVWVGPDDRGIELKIVALDLPALERCLEGTGGGDTTCRPARTRPKGT